MMDEVHMEVSTKIIHYWLWW